ncbi:MAG: hypothetical protein ACD_58C00266G0001 [uncultured bacterium]|nr:MAG: hypothetical protein ACD_58C00266G0001 [uncultured bacterium]
MILFPNIEQAKAFQDLLPNSQLSSNNIFSKKNIKSVLYHSEMTKTQRYNIWADIRNNKHQVVIGTRPTVFAPINNLGLVVIDQGENFGYKEDQSSRYLSVTVAKKLCELTGANLVFGSLVPNVEGYYYEQHKKYLRLQNKPLESKKLISKRIIDLNTQKNKMISWELEESINKTIENNGKVLLFSQRKGEGSSFICQDCGHVFKCDRCSLPYTQVTSVQSQGIRLKCFRCNVKILVPKSCPNCRGIKLKSIGLGIDRIRDVIYKLFPNVKSIQIDVDSENIEQKIDSNQIIIATKKILDYNLKFNLVGIVNLDNLLNLPDYKTSENIYFTVVKLMYMTSKNFILQTFNPENKLWYFIRQSCPNVFLKDELLVRKDNNFPPFSQLIKLTYQNEFEEKCQKETEITKLQVTSYKLQVLWPGPSFIAKVRGRFQYQMIVFIKLKLEKELLKKIVSKLAKGWKIDVDPISLI